MLKALFSTRGLCLALAVLDGLISPSRAGSQERPAKRLASIVGVALEEYGKGVDSAGRLISKTEYDEAASFLSDAREVVRRIAGDRAESARTALDSLIAAVARRVPPAELQPIRARFDASLGADAALDMPTRPIDLANGRALFEKACAECHGMTGRGDGPKSRDLKPTPAPLGDAVAMRDRTPAIQFRIISVGVAGTPMVAWAGTLTPDDRWDVVWYLHALRHGAARGEGEGLYLQRCAGCHGVTGASDGPLSVALARLPAELSSFAWQAERSDAQMEAAIAQGVKGTAMPPNRELPVEDVRRLVGYVRLLALYDVPARQAVRTADTSDGSGTARAVMRLLDEALGAARAGRKSDAGDRAFDAYILFEPLETPARARSPGMVGSMERHFADFKGAIKSDDLRSAEGSRNAIEAGMPAILALVQPARGRWGAFFQSFLIILREGFEAILVIGAIVAFLLKTGHRERLHAIWLGVGGAVVASAVTAFVLSTVLSAIPASREILEGVTMLVAVAVLFSVSYWLISKVEAARWQQFIREKVSTALNQGGGTALAFVAFLAVYREGAETALFYQALFREGAGMGVPLSLGILVGGVALAIIFTLFYRYGVRIPLRPFFATTSALLYYMAFVFMGKGVRELQEGDVVSITVLPGWPHVETLGIFPSVETLLAQLVLLVLFVFALLKTFWPSRSVALPTIPTDAAAGSGVNNDDRLVQMAGRLAELEAKLHSLEQVVQESQGIGNRE